MATGEYVSVHSQADTDPPRWNWSGSELKKKPDSEQRELAAVYVARGLDPALATQVAMQLIARDPLGAYARDELGLSAALSARPLQAALASACSFSTGAAMPLLVVALAPRRT